MSEDGIERGEIRSQDDFSMLSGGACITEKQPEIKRTRYNLRRRTLQRVCNFAELSLNTGSFDASLLRSCGHVGLVRLEECVLSLKK